MGLIQCRAEKWNDKLRQEGLWEQALIKENSSQLQDADTCSLTQAQERLSGKAVILMHTCQLRGEDPRRIRGLPPAAPQVHKESPPLLSQSPCFQHPPPAPPHALLQSFLALPRGGNRGNKRKHFLAVEGQSLILRSFSPSQTFPLDSQDIAQTENSHHATWHLH